MENPTNAELSKQIETVAQTVASIYAQMATKEELNAVRQEVAATKDELHALRTDMHTRLDHIEKGYGYRITNLERDVAELKA